MPKGSLHFQRASRGTRLRAKPEVGRGPENEGAKKLSSSQGNHIISHILYTLESLELRTP
jgi:hypothetical protein